MTDAAAQQIAAALDGLSDQVFALREQVARISQTASAVGAIMGDPAHAERVLTMLRRLGVDGLQRAATAEVDDA